MEGFVEARVGEGGGAWFEEEGEHERAVDVDQYSQAAEVFRDRILWR